MPRPLYQRGRLPATSPGGDAFAAFCRAQQVRIAWRLAQAESRVHKAQVESRRGAQETWQTRGRVAGACGLTYRPADEE